jgi:hypothetical protein
MFAGLLLMAINQTNGGFGLCLGVSVLWMGV